jgi:hypothetical protein
MRRHGRLEDAPNAARHPDAEPGQAEEPHAPSGSS